MKGRGPRGSGPGGASVAKGRTVSERAVRSARERAPDHTPCARRPVARSRSRHSPPQEAAKRGRPGALLPGVRDPGSRRLRGRLARAREARDAGLGAGHRVRGRALHGRDVEDPHAGKDGRRAGPRGGLLARGRLSGAVFRRVAEEIPGSHGRPLHQLLGGREGAFGRHRDVVLGRSHSEADPRSGRVRAGPEPRRMAREEAEPQVRGVAGNLHRARDVLGEEARRPHDASSRRGGHRASGVRRADPASRVRRGLDLRPPEARRDVAESRVHRGNRGRDPPPDAPGGAGENAHPRAAGRGLRVQHLPAHEAQHALEAISLPARPRAGDRSSRKRESQGEARNRPHAGDDGGDASAPRRLAVLPPPRAPRVSGKKETPRPPLEEVVVLDLSRVLAGPLATMVLADLGARIVKVEDPCGGDFSRGWKPPALDGEAAYFLSVNRRKESAAVDLGTPAGAEFVRRWAAKADVLVENFLPGALERRGLGVESLRELNPRLVVCSISGAGDVGPEAGEPGFDLLAQGATGHMWITGPAEGTPHKMGVALIDVLAGWSAATAILGALRARERDGTGAHVKTNLVSTGLAALVNVAGSALVTGKEATRHGNSHATIEPYRAFEAADGGFLLAVGTDRQFEVLF